MKKIIYLILFFVFTFLIVTAYKVKSTTNTGIAVPLAQITWQIKSIDTMKESRDLAQAKLNDKYFNSTIQAHVKTIKDLGANYIAIDTPYDEKFYPYLLLWVQSARSNNLHVWFKGNFSQWEGWFDEKKNPSQDDHIQATITFIQNHPDLFKDRDIFSPCPECENGGPGDPRYSTSPEGFRKFIINEHNAADIEFKKLGKNVSTNYYPMNLDVANLVMDRDTTAAMGNLIVIDHYVKEPTKLESDVDELIKKTGAKIFLGEFGTPIPNLNDNYTDEAQQSWIDEALSSLLKKENVIGVNYWVLTGGSTAIVNADDTKKPAAEVIKKYFSLQNLD